MSEMKVNITDQPIDLQAIVAELAALDTAQNSNGAQVIFSGIVRATNNGKQVLAVSYDVFSPMTESVLREIACEAQAKSKAPLKIAIVHRRGKLLVGELSVVIGVSSPHRSEAYEASRLIIEELKARAPIWKKEHYRDGETEWLKGHALCSHH